MAETGATKLITFTGVAPGATASGWWNNASAEVYRLNAWPKVSPGVSASAEITKVSSVVHGSPYEREVHFSVKNTGSTTIDIDVWALTWNWQLQPVLKDVVTKFGVPAVGGAIVTTRGIDGLAVAGIRKNGDPTAVQSGDSWHLGSDTKAMTATLAGILVQKGKIAWDLTLSQAFPQWTQTMKGAYKDMPLAQLTGHRSGVGDPTTAEGTALADTSKTTTERRREFARLVVHTSPGGTAGVFDYQNTNFIVAAAMMESKTGKSWEDMMKTELFQPLGMSTAGFGSPGSDANVNQPWGHSDATGQRVPTKGDNTPALGPAGTVHASLEDWAKFIRLHLTGSEGSLTLSTATLTHLHTQYPPTSASPDRYGWGWIIWDDVDGMGLGHDGSNGVWYCSCQLLVADGVGFIAVSNIGGDTNGKGDQACWEVVTKLREHYLGR
jgi:CubicO group peptidase (beta-lactamase class C family)